MTRGNSLPFACAVLMSLSLLTPSLAAADKWQELNLPWHRIYATTEATEFALAVSRAIEASARPIADRYGYTPRDTTVWVLHDDVEWFNGAAYTLSNRIMLWGTSGDFELRGHAPWVDNVVAHEYSHLATLSLARRYPRWLGGIVLGGIEESSLGRTNPNVTSAKAGFSAFVPSERVPRWFSEGIAQYDAELQSNDRWDTTRQMLERTAWHEDKVMSLHDMGSVVGKTWFGAEQVYNQGYSLARFLGDRFGPESLANLLSIEANQAFAGFEQALEKTYGVPVTALEQAWHGAIATRAAASMPSTGDTFAATTTYQEDGPFNQVPVFDWRYEKIAFTSDGKVDYPRNRLVVAPTTSPSEQTTLTSRIVDAPTWSPAGDFLIVTKTRMLRRPARETYDLHKVDAQTGKGDWLTKGQRLRWPAMHPQGVTVAAAQRGQGTWDLAVFSLATSSVTALTALPWGWQIRELSFDHEGRLWGVLVRDHEVDIAEFSLSDPSRVRIIDWPGSEEHAPRLGPDGRLWFSSDKTGSFQLYALDVSLGTVQPQTNLVGGAFTPAPAVTETIFVRYDHHRYTLARLPVTADVRGAEIETIRWQNIDIPRRDIASASSEHHFRRAKFRLGRPIVYPEFQYLYGEPLGGAVAFIQDELGHHYAQLEVLAGRAVDINAEYTYTGLPPSLTLRGRRYWGNLNIGLRMPFTWDSAEAEILYSPARQWLLGGSIDADRIRYVDELAIFQVGGPLTRLKRHGGTILAQWADMAGRARNDIDPRGTVLFASTGVARSQPQLLSLDDITSTFFLLPDDYWYTRLYGDGFWATGKGRFTAELGMQVGWASRDVDPSDEFFVGGNVFNLRRGEFRSYSNLPGYEDFAVSGEKLLIARAATRAMLATDMGGAGPFLFDALLLQLAVEGGNAWPHQAGFGDIFKSWGKGHVYADGPRPQQTTLTISPTDPRFMGLLFDTVAELRLKTILFDYVSWDSFLRVAYGFQDGVWDDTTDSFSRSGKLPVRVYLGVGTGW